MCSYSWSSLWLFINFIEFIQTLPKQWRKCEQPIKNETKPYPPCTNATCKSFRPVAPLMNVQPADPQTKCAIKDNKKAFACSWRPFIPSHWATGSSNLFVLIFFQVAPLPACMDLWLELVEDIIGHKNVVTCPFLQYPLPYPPESSALENGLQNFMMFKS